MHEHTNSITRLVLLSAGLSTSVLACSGRIEASAAPPNDAAAPSVEASTEEDAGAPADASSECAELTAAIEHGLAIYGGPYVQGHDADFLAYFQKLAEADQLVVPAHHVDCASPADAGMCTYDPRQPRLDAADVHYSDDRHEFSGPDGLAWIWAYVPKWGTSTAPWYIAANQTMTANAYKVLGEYNACTLGADD